mmetsp:Transcript_23047/g.41113  ORF Transcript_23047/g.41113 Transcript_23047/m.41113 type:complete len:541 (-) Transcript_23047:107-1729(-)
MHALEREQVGDLLEGDLLGDASGDGMFSGGIPGGGGGGSSGGGEGRHQKRRRMIHHDDVNMALSWRGSEKLYVSGVPMVSPAESNDDGATGEGTTSDKNKQGTTTNDTNNTGSEGSIHRLLKNTTNNKSSDVPSLLKSSTVPRVDLNAYLRSELAVRPPSEMGMTLHWLAVDGTSPMIPMNEVWNDACAEANNQGGLPSGGVAPVLELGDHDDNNTNLTGASTTTGNKSDDGDKSNEEDSSIRIRELQHRLLSEELQLYYARVTSTIENNSADTTAHNALSVALRGIRSDAGIQELVPFLSRFVASGLMAKKNLHRTEYCRRLIRLFDAMLDNRALHLDLHLHQMFTPVGTCIVAKKLSPGLSPYEDHWSLREEAARSLVKACDIYGDQYTTMKPRIIKLLTQQALRVDRPLATQYGGIVGISLFGPRAVDAFLLPLAREYWERWEGELHRLTNVDVADDNATVDNNNSNNGEKKKRDVGREYELQMCQQALLDAVQIFVQNVTPGEQAKRVDIGTFADVFGERLIPMRPDVSDYMSAVV